MGRVEKAGILLRELIVGPVTSSTKRKGYREVILALAGLSLVSESRPYEEELKRLLEESDQDLQNWQRVKDEWALAKCALL